MIDYIEDVSQAGLGRRKKYFWFWNQMMAGRLSKCLIKCDHIFLFYFRFCYAQKARTDFQIPKE